MTQPVRTADLEWSMRAAAGELEGLDWVCTDLDRGLPDWHARGEDHDARFHATSMTKFAPEAPARAAIAAQKDGDATLQEGLQLLFARILWMARTRRLYWTPDTPIPDLLAALVEADGVGPEVHRNDLQTLARIAARLPTWRKRRGELEAGLRLLEEGARYRPEERLRGTDDTGALADEVFACHSEPFWTARCSGDASLSYRIDGGYLRFQDPDQPAFGLLREDVLVQTEEEDALARRLFRLLPSWAVYRLVLPTGPPATKDTP